MVWVLRLKGGHRRQSTRYTVRKEFFDRDTDGGYVDPEVRHMEREQEKAAKAKRAAEVIREVKISNVPVPKPKKKPAPQVIHKPKPKPKPKEPEIIGYRVELEYNPPSDSPRGWDHEYEQRAKQKER